jgi:hypothetical protein
MITLRRVAGALCAEVDSADLSKPLSAELVVERRQAWLETLVPFFRDLKAGARKLCKNAKILRLILSKWRSCAPCSGSALGKRRPIL